MTDCETTRVEAEQEPQIANMDEIDFWTLLMESRVIQAG